MHTISAEIADYIAKKSKALIFERDKTQPLTKAKHHPTASLIWRISRRVSWHKIYDEALNHVSKGTATIQRIIKILTHPNHPDVNCYFCGNLFKTSFLNHIHTCHPIIAYNFILSTDDIINALTNLSTDLLFTIKFS